MGLSKFLFVSILIFLCGRPAFAVLGEQINPQSVEIKSKFSISSVPEDRKKVKEFFVKSGDVFGTCYDPRIAKDLSQILGAKYSALFSKSIKESAAKVGKGHPRIQIVKNNDLFIRSARLGRSLSICVCDPNKVPEGVSCNDVR
jgi:hypothetical protein